jgi:LEA14-like dessication related protein
MKRTASLLLLLVLAGCALTRLETPRLQVVGVQVQRSDLFQQQLRVRMRVQNPNDRELPVRSITYQMEVAGESFASGESVQAFVIPALGSTEFDVNVSANAAGAVLKLLSGGGRLDAVDYRLVGRVMLSSGLLRTIPFEQRGNFKLR